MSTATTKKTPKKTTKKTTKKTPKKAPRGPTCAQGSARIDSADLKRIIPILKRGRRAFTDAESKCRWHMSIRFTPHGIEFDTHTSTAGVKITVPCTSRIERHVHVHAKRFFDTSEAAMVDSDSIMISISDVGDTDCPTVVLIDEHGIEFRIAPVFIGEGDLVAAPGGVTAHPIGKSWTGLDTMIKEIAMHASDDPARLNINGIAFEHDGTAGRLIATTGHRLAIRKMPQSKGPPTDLMVLDRSIVGLLTDAPTEIRRTDEHLFFLSPNHVAFTKIKNTTFPPYRQIIPKLIDPDLSAPKERLATIARKFADVAAAGVPIVMSCTKDKLSFRLDSEDVDAVALDVDVKGCSGTEEHLALNPQYLRDSLNFIHSSKVRLQWSGSLDPLLISDPGIQNCIILMPMRH